MAAKQCQSCTYGRVVPQGYDDESPAMHCYRNPPQPVILPSGRITWRRPEVRPTDGPCGEFKGA